MGDRPIRSTESVCARVQFSSYGQLLRALLPTARFAAVARDDLFGCWTSCEEASYELLPAARRALKRAGTGSDPITTERIGVQDDGRAINALSLRDAAGVVAVVTMCHGGLFSEQSLQEVGELLRPVLECLAREIALQSGAVSAGARAIAGLSVHAESAADGADDDRLLVCNGYELGRFVDGALTLLGSLMATLIVPEKNLAIVRRRDAMAARSASDFITRAHRSLMLWAVQKGRPLVVNEVGMSARLPPCRILSVRLRSTSGRVVGFLAFLNAGDGTPFTYNDVRLAEGLASRIETILQTNYDSLTGLATRAAFERDAQIMIGRTAGAAPCSAVYLDIDGMGLINEHFSMPVGDAVIGEVGSVIQRHAPRGALAARLAGDRYAVLIPGADVEEAATFAHSLAAAITEVTATPLQSALRVSVSTGVAAVQPTSAQPLAHALAAAEQASKHAKRDGALGGNRVSIAPLSCAAVESPDALSVADLRAWLEADRFELHAQPVLALTDAAPEPRFEVLLRGLSAQGEALTPGKLIAAAERHGLMPAIDAWVIDKTFAMLKAQATLMRTRSARFSVNLSGQSLADDTLPAIIEAAWRRSGLSADVVCFEIAEAAVIAAPEPAVRFMHRLRRLGFQTALDDAGSERLTANQITALPLDMIKLDGSVVRRAATDPMCAARLADMISRARTLRRATVANGVETDAQRALMATLGADYGQGYAIGRPSPLSIVLRDVALYSQIDAGASGTASTRRA